MVYKELHILNWYNLITLNICKHLWYHHHNQGNSHILYLQEFPCVRFVLFVVRTLNVWSTLFTNFEVYNVVLLSTGMYCIADPTSCSSSITEMLYSLNNNSLLSLSSEPLETTIVFSISGHLTILGISYKWNHSVYVLLWLVYFTWHNVL